jgi:hypothetical protein
VRVRVTAMTYSRNWRRLTAEFGSGFSLTNLKLMRQFYLQNAARIGQTLSDQLSVFRLSWSMPHSDRTARFAQISAALAQQSDEQLTCLVNEAEQLATGIGGSTMAFDIDGVRIFAKRVRLTDLERRPEHRMSTANLFELRTYCQRNVGSAGFGVWREVAANLMTTAWVLARQLESFPLMYHWRVLECAASPGAKPAPDELADIEGMVSYWEGSQAMGVRLKALADATASVMIFLEYVPWNLSEWLSRQMAAGLEAMESACAIVEHGLTVDVPLMNALGLLHGDAHHGNILTDGHRLYFADLGLATSASFDLSNDERSYLQRHASLDRAYVRAKWVNGLVKTWASAGSGLPERMEWVRSMAQGQAVRGLIPDMPPRIASIVRRHAPVATAINDFYVQLRNTSRRASYPRDEIERLLGFLCITQIHN